MKRHLSAGECPRTGAIRDEENHLCFFLAGSDKNKWCDYDATELAKSYSGPSLTALIDVGLNDEFFKDLLPAKLVEVGNDKFKINYREQDGYDHSYYFIATFIEDHIKMHSEALK